MATDADGRVPDLVVDDTSGFDELAARAGAALRRPAPEHGIVDVVRLGQRRRVVTAVVAGGAAIVLIVAGVTLIRHDSDAKPVGPVTPITATTVADEPVTTLADDTVPSTTTSVTEPSASPATQTITPPERVQSAKFMPDGRVLVDLGNGLMIWDVANGTQSEAFGEQVRSSASYVLPIVSPDGTKVLYHDVVWDIRTGDRLVSNFGRGGPLGPGNQSPFSPDSTKVITMNSPVPHEGGAEIRDTTSGKVQLTLTSADDSGIFYASFSPDGTKIVTSGFAIPRVWDVATGTQLLSIDEDLGDPTVATLSPDGRKIVSAVPLSTNEPSATRWAIRVRDATTGDLLYEIDTTHLDAYIGFLAASFGPDGKLFIPRTNGSTTEVVIVDADTGRELTTIGPVASEWLLSKAGPGAFSPDGSKIVTVFGSTATVWDTATGQVLRVLDGHVSDDVLTAEFSPDGSSIVTAGGTAGVTIWNLSRQ
jgi:WD40 repeat protein